MITDLVTQGNKKFNNSLVFICIEGSRSFSLLIELYLLPVMISPQKN